MPTVLVTGTSSGIGEQIAKYLLSQNVNVIGVARRSIGSGWGSNYKHIQGDLTNPDTVASVADAVGSKLDGAVFNAGLLDSIHRLANTDMDSFRQVFEINLFSVVSLTKALIPALRAARGRAIYVSSGASTNSYTAWAAYGSSKAALNVVVATLAKEEPDIIAVSVAPGVVDTSMQDVIRGTHAGAGEMSEEEISKFVDLKKSGKLVDPKSSGELYGKLALGASKKLSGKYLRYDDPQVLAE